MNFLKLLKIIGNLRILETKHISKSMCVNMYVERRENILENILEFLCLLIINLSCYDTNLLSCIT